MAQLTASNDKRCRVCGRLYVQGKNGLCRACQRAKTQARTRGPQHKRLRCDCGKPAVTVAAVRVGEDGVYLVRLPLCADCLKIEQSYGLVGGVIKPANDSTG
jgi:hypothetical protein